MSPKLWMTLTPSKPASSLVQAPIFLVPNPPNPLHFPSFFGFFYLPAWKDLQLNTLLGWEKLPPASRKALSKSTLASLANFPSDWPEVEYLTAAAYMGDNVNYALSTPTDGFNYAAVLAALVAPLSRGTVTISSADTADPPIIDPRWLTDPADQAVAVAAYKRLRQLFAAKSMAPVLIGPEFYPGLNGTTTDEELLAVIKRSFQTVWHASCTCQMGKKDDKMAVVDQSAKVIGVEKLRVVDASAFALLPPGHPSSTVCECPISFSTIACLQRSCE
jgi:choline dehydrogenase